tara:strand:+ start:281 stop:715 length:435 start_codon:yes stop_codon:yes gene_type:complete
VCGAVCGQQCNNLGTTNYSDWAAILDASADTCFASYTENGIHGVHDPYIYQSFNGFGAYTLAYPGIFPAAISTTTSVVPTVLYPDDKDDDNITYIIAAAVGVTVLSIAIIVSFSWFSSKKKSKYRRGSPSSKANSDESVLYSWF